MNPKFARASTIAYALTLGLLAGVTGCRKTTVAAATASPSVAIVADELGKNNLGDLPGAIYQCQAGSKIHWQTWTKESMKRAEKAHKLILAVIAMPQYPGFQKSMDSLNSDPAIIKTINDTYVPILVDGNASREMGLIVVELCTEQKRNAKFPLLLWLTPAGNPTAWIYEQGQESSLKEVFEKSHAIITRSWSNDVNYVLNNSQLDNIARAERILERSSKRATSQEPAEDVVRALRQLNSFYDMFSRTFDQAGGIFPSGAISLLATSAIHPGLPPEIRNRCMETTRELMKDLLASAMFDPLDGGVFTMRRGTSWMFPGFARDCGSQSRAAVALLDAYRATGDSWALERALGLITYSENAFATDDGLFSLGLPDEKDPSFWLWRVDEVEKILGPEDAAWWIKLTGMKDLGNLPMELDSRRKFFRLNSVALTSPTPGLAASMKQSVEDFSGKLNHVRSKLLTARNQKTGEIFRDKNANPTVTFRMVSAYAAAFGATGDTTYRDKALVTLKKARKAFGDGPRLRTFVTGTPGPIGDGRAFLYGLGIAAALDVASITSEETWATWAEDLATTSAELFTESDYLKECPDDAKIINLPISDLKMTFDESTAGMFSAAECRLSQRGRPLPSSFSKLAAPLPLASVESPILHTDLLQASLAREFSVVVVCSPGISPEMKLAAERLPLRSIQRRSAKATDEIPDGAVKLIFSGGESRIVTTPADLQHASLLLEKKS